MRLGRLFGEGEFGHHACTIAVAPSPIVCRRRYERGQVFPAPSPAVAALDLPEILPVVARSSSRGRETLIRTFDVSGEPIVIVAERDSIVEARSIRRVVSRAGGPAAATQWSLSSNLNRWINNRHRGNIH
jgi:hypothetical protein